MSVVASGGASGGIEIANFLLKNSLKLCFISSIVSLFTPSPHYFWAYDSIQGRIIILILCLLIFILFVY